MISGLRHNFNKTVLASISTSKKNTDSVTINEKYTSVSQKDNVPIHERDENWVSYGYDLVDKENDSWMHHSFMFLGITLLLGGSVFILAYLPDVRAMDWHRREAFLELSRREQLGLPLVDRNLVDPEKVMAQLPSDEDLGDADIII